MNSESVGAVLAFLLCCTTSGATALLLEKCAGRGKINPFWHGVAGFSAAALVLTYIL